MISHSPPETVTSRHDVSEGRVIGGLGKGEGTGDGAFSLSPSSLLVLPSSSGIVSSPEPCC